MNMGATTDWSYRNFELSNVSIQNLYLFIKYLITIEDPNWLIIDTSQRLHTSEMI